jgi:gamma-glutamylcyclotransferase (GGCT)/AIG2-like uncharacterized protein YtfP
LRKAGTHTLFLGRRKPSQAGRPEAGATPRCWLFVYGTLRDPAVQRRVFGRITGGIPDALAGFELGTIQIGGAEYPILRPGSPTARIEGLALELTEAELTTADAYETEAYARIEVTLVSGRRAFVYAAA